MAMTWLSNYNKVNISDMNTDDDIICLTERFSSLPRYLWLKENEYGELIKKQKEIRVLYKEILNGECIVQLGFIPKSDKSIVSFIKKDEFVSLLGGVVPENMYRIIISKLKHYPADKEAAAAAEDEEIVTVEEHHDKKTKIIPYFSIVARINGEMMIDVMEDWMRTRSSVVLEVLKIGSNSNRFERDIQLRTAVSSLLKMNAEDYLHSFHVAELFMYSLIKNEQELKRIINAEAEIFIQRLKNEKHDIVDVLRSIGVIVYNKNFSYNQWKENFGISDDDIKSVFVEEIVLTNDDDDDCEFISTIRPLLEQTFYSNRSNRKEKFPHRWFSTSFENVLKLISSREVFLFNGKAYLTELQLRDCYSVELFKLFSRKRISRFQDGVWNPKAVAEFKLDQRIGYLRAFGSWRLTQLRKKKNDCVTTITDIEDLVTNGPLCIRYLDNLRRKDRHLKFNDRQQYMITALSVNCSFDQVMNRWFAPHEWNGGDEKQHKASYKSLESKMRKEHYEISCYNIVKDKGVKYRCPFYQLRENDLDKLMNSNLKPEDKNQIHSIAKKDPVFACHKYLQLETESSSIHEKRFRTATQYWNLRKKKKTTK